MTTHIFVIIMMCMCVMCALSFYGMQCLLRIYHSFKE